MHEAGIAASILEIAEREARNVGAAPILSIKVKVGEFTAVVPEALEFAFEALRPGTRAAGARLIIERVPLEGTCPDCAWSGAPQRGFCLLCPRCEAPVRVSAGRELAVEYIEVENQEPVCNECL